MPSPNTLALPIAARDQRWTCHSSARRCGQLYVYDKVNRRSLWVSDVMEGFRCFKEWLADAPPEQKAGGSGDETGSLQARYQPLCRDFRRGCCRRKSCRFRHEVSHGAPVREKYAAADAAPVPPLRRQCRDVYGCCNPPDNAAANAALLWICKDYANGYCKRGPNCPLRHDKTEAAQLRDVPPPPGVCRYFFDTVDATTGPDASTRM